MRIAWVRLCILIFMIAPCLLNGQDSGSKRYSQSWVVYPAFGYQPETGFQLGAFALGVLQSSDTSQSDYDRQSSFAPFLIYTVRNQFLSAVNVDYFFKSGLNLNITPRAFNFPDRYFGIGNANDPDTFENYTIRFFQLEGQLSIPRSDRRFLGLAFDMQSSSIVQKESGGFLENKAITGSEGGNQFGIGPAIRYDSRNNAIYPSSGYFLNVNSIFTYLGDFDYTSLSADLRKYFSIREDVDVIAIQLGGFFTLDDNIPFFKLPQLGGDNRLRGISNASLYRDRQTIFTQIEYRKHIWKPFGAVAFAGVGDVAPTFNAFDLEEFKYVAGLGLRYQVIRAQRLNVRFDYGFARGGQSAFYISIREAF
jgi:outer membrane protein assembly factor BamA